MEYLISLALRYDDVIPNYSTIMLDHVLPCVCSDQIIHDTIKHVLPCFALYDRPVWMGLMLRLQAYMYMTAVAGRLTKRDSADLRLGTFVGGYVVL